MHLDSGGDQIVGERRILGAKVLGDFLARHGKLDLVEALICKVVDGLDDLLWRLDESGDARDEGAILRCELRRNEGRSAGKLEVER
jgi:hypothetical protein